MCVLVLVLDVLVVMARVRVDMGLLAMAVLVAVWVVVGVLPGHRGRPLGGGDGPESSCHRNPLQVGSEWSCPDRLLISP